MITAKASQKTFTYAEVVKLTGICVDHLQNFATLDPRASQRMMFLAFHLALRP
jgi:hypothetical protein